MIIRNPQNPILIIKAPTFNCTSKSPRSVSGSPLGLHFAGASLLLGVAASGLVSSLGFRFRVFT